ncbi:unnamed protein product [Musa hybrid cultivar]
MDQQIQTKIISHATDMRAESSIKSHPKQLLCAVPFHQILQDGTTQQAAETYPATACVVAQRRQRSGRRRLQGGGSASTGKKAAHLPSKVDLLVSLLTYLSIRCAQRVKEGEEEIERIQCLLTR